MATSITNVRVFDGAALVNASAVRIDGPAVVAIGDPSMVRPEDEIIDGQQGTLLPGLIDAHVHLLPGASVQAISFGVTTMLDMFSKPDLLAAERAESHPQPIAGVYTSSIGATAPGGHPSMMYAPFPTIREPSDAERFVQDRLNEGARYLKIFYEGGQSIEWAMPSLTVTCVRALVESAHKAGMLVVAHAQRSVDAVEVAEAGVDVLAHAPLDPMNAKQIDTLANRGVAVISTLSIADGFPIASGQMPLLEDPRIAERLGDRWSATIRSQSDRWVPPGMPAFLDAYSNIRQLHRAGVPILAGTDAPNPGTIHGASIHRELWHLTQAGLTPIQALRAATSATAKVFGLDDLGHVRPGSTADLVLIQGKPDIAIDSSTAIERVWRAGRHVDIERYVGSQSEDAGLNFLAAQTARVIASVTAKLSHVQKEDS